jgi:hypothetical protein
MFRVGDRLHASCSDEDYGEVIAIGADDNAAPTVDLVMFDAQDLLGGSAEEDMQGGWSPSLCELELPEGVRPILRAVQWKSEGNDGYTSDRDIDGYRSTGLVVELLTPGSGCYRCTKLFTIWRKP